jgi:ubiquitin-protein ligase
MGQITEDTTFVTASSAISTELEGEAVILDTAASEYYGLNEVGTRIWTLLQEPRTLDEIVKVLVEEYSVDRDQCEEDVRKLLNQMTEKNLLEVRPDDSTDDQ